MTDIKTKYLGGMVGSALGDAIGEIAFQYRKKESLCIQLDRSKEFSYTDDTAMSIGLAESIIKKGCLYLSQSSYYCLACTGWKIFKKRQYSILSFYL